MAPDSFYLDPILIEIGRFQSRSNLATMRTNSMTRFIGSRRKLLSGGVGLATTALLSCSEDDGHCAFEDVDVEGAAHNPDGVPYPADAMGAVAGEVFPNFVFRGFRGSGSDLVVISLADYFDPHRTRHRMLHVMLAAMWCSVSRGQSQLMAEEEPMLRSEGLEVVQVIMDGTRQNSAPDRCDLQGWIDRQGIAFPVVFDVFARRIGTVVRIEGIPWNVLIDTSTMKVISSVFGAPVDYAGYIRRELAGL